MHNFNSKILREYDIRGTVGINLSASDAMLLAERFVALNPNIKKICVGRDGRHSSPELANGLISSLEEYGMHVIDVGLVPTPALYFSVKHFEADAGIMVTGSHNPPQDNGFKITLADRPYFGDDIQKLGQPLSIDCCEGGYLEVIDVIDAYITLLANVWKVDSSRLKVVWDCGNGAAGVIIPELVNHLAGQHILLNTHVDGEFPAHPPDPTVEENLKQLKHTLKEHKADLGIAFDGDADRIVAIDALGNTLYGDQLLMIFAEEVLKKQPGAQIIADVKSSQGFIEHIHSHGGVPILWRTGHSHIKAKLKEIKAPLAGEMSGHIFFADEYYGFDDGIYAAMRLLRLVHEHSLHGLTLRLPIYPSTPEIRICCPNKFEVIDALKKKFSNQSYLDIDGLRVTSENGWWLVRASQTQDLLVVRCEGNTENDLRCLIERLREALKPHNVTLPY